jgi:formamidopyrimidine-DNA glycosylase
MPELPEVETIKRDLFSNVVGKKITDINFLWPGILKGTNIKEFRRLVVGQKILNVNRRAKMIDIMMSNGYSLLLHMKMTGHLIVAGAEWKVDKMGKWVKRGNAESPLYDPLNQYIRAIFWLSDGNILAFSDLRKFGYIKLVDKGELEEIYNTYGEEPLTGDFNIEYLRSILDNNNLAIKKILMDQKQISGIGNIYADEILWDAKIHPLTRGKNISASDVTKLYNAIENILKDAVRLRGTSTSDFRDTSGRKGGYGDILKAYKRNGQPCQRCEREIERIVVGGRGTHFCPHCQKEKND